MKCNIGCFERNLRITLGAVLVTLAATKTLDAWAWIGLLPLTTGLIRFCPAYALFNRNGCCKSKDGSSDCK
jgi:Protein of unknown function (DUF2892)